MKFAYISDHFPYGGYVSARSILHDTNSLKNMLEYIDNNALISENFCFSFYFLPHMS
jgi:hypothetical protein